MNPTISSEWTFARRLGSSYSCFALSLAVCPGCKDVGDYRQVIVDRASVSDAASDGGASAVEPRDSSRDAHLDAPDAHVDAPDAHLDATDADAPLPDGQTDARSDGDAAQSKFSSDPYGLLASRPETCRTCAELSCPGVLLACGALPGKAAAGPANGEEKSTLCAESLRCVIDSGCAKGDLLTCYCGTASVAACTSSSSADGQCKASLERALETNDKRLLPGRLERFDLAGGAASAVIQCLHDSRCDTCF